MIARLRGRRLDYRNRMAQILGALLLGLVGIAAQAQTVGPVIVEYREKARGKFEIANNSPFPLYVVLEPKSFDLMEAGQVKYRPLDGGIHLRLSATSFSVPPRGTHYVFYEATADKLPVWFVIFNTIGGLPDQSGLTVRLVLPHTVYLLQKQKFRKTDVQIPGAEFEPQTGNGVVELVNSSPYLGRVQSVEILSDVKKDKQLLGGFPLFPHSTRRVEFVWNKPERPTSVVIRFEHFKVQRKLLGENHRGGGG